MKALSGDFPDKSSAILAAGVDIVLHCNGVMEEMQGIVAGAKPLEGRALELFTIERERINTLRQVRANETTSGQQAALTPTVAPARSASP